jgi:hypothetical protein
MCWRLQPAPEAATLYARWSDARRAVGVGRDWLGARGRRRAAHGHARGGAAAARAQHTRGAERGGNSCNPAYIQAAALCISRLQPCAPRLQPYVHLQVARFAATRLLFFELRGPLLGELYARSVDEPPEQVLEPHAELTLALPLPTSTLALTPTLARTPTPTPTLIPALFLTLTEQMAALLPLLAERVSSMVRLVLPELAAEIALAVLRAALAAFEHVLLDGGARAFVPRDAPTLEEELQALALALAPALALALALALILTLTLTLVLSLPRRCSTSSCSTSTTAAAASSSRPP